MVGPEACIDIADNRLSIVLTRSSRQSINVATNNTFLGHKNAATGIVGLARVRGSTNHLHRGSFSKVPFAFIFN